MLDYIYKSCYETASQLRGWQDLDKNEIANLYLDNRNGEKRDVYAAALLCRYWYKVGLLWRKDGNAITQEDCYAIVWDGIERAMDYAPWRNADNSLYEDPNGPDKAINVCIESVRKSLYNYSSRDKRKLNHKSNVISMDALHELTGDYSDQLLDDFCATDDQFLTKDLHVVLYIKDLLEHDKMPEAIIIDNICFNDSLTSGAEGVQFNRKKFVLLLHALGSEFIERFAADYGVGEDEVKECVRQINSLSQFKLHKLIDRTLYLTKKNWGFADVS